MRYLLMLIAGATGLQAAENATVFAHYSFGYTMGESTGERTVYLGALAPCLYQHVVRPNEAAAGHPQISPITQIPPRIIGRLTMRPHGNLRHLRNLRISGPLRSSCCRDAASHR